MIQLRDYQLDLVSAVWNDLFLQNNVLISAPCGAGKTECFIELCRKSIELMPSIKILIILNRVLLVEQTARRIKKVIPSCGIFCGTLNEKEIGQITVASVQSIYKHDLGKINMVILDEVHHLSEDDDSHYKKLLKSLEHDKLKVVGFTATPYRADGKIYGENKFFEKLSYKKSVNSMIEEKYLVRPLMKKVEHQFDTSELRIRLGEFKQEDVNKLTENLEQLEEQVSDALERCKDRNKIVWACASIQHCDNVCREINKRGEYAVKVHSKHKDSDLDKDTFENASARHLVFVTIVSEGYDYSPIDCIVLMRPIRSPVLYVQTIGRGLRLHHSKKDCLVLDYGRVVETLGPIDNPLISDGRVRKNAKPQEMKVCKKCQEYCALDCDYCPTCENPFIRIDNSGYKKLDQKPGYAQLLSSIPVEKFFDVSSVELSKYKSKNDNVCLRVDYVSNDILGQRISEYFVFTNQWAYKKAQNRLIEFECDLKPTLDEQIYSKPKRIPKQLVYEMDGKYKKIKRLIF